jgi:regulator of sigma E protease
MNLLGILDWIGSFGLLVLGFGFIILVHELGHFLVAKAVGIKVLQFAIGFGPAAVSWRKGLGFCVGSSEPAVKRRVEAYINDAKDRVVTERDQPAADKSRPAPTADQAMAALGLGETEYRFNYVPLGGYVKMLGQEDLNPEAQSEDARAYNRKSVGARACVISAGVAMNLVFAVLFFIIAFMAGIQMPSAIIGRVQPGSPAATTTARGHEGEAYVGVRLNDRILAINGQPISDFTEVRVAGALDLPHHPIELTIRRPGETRDLNYDITPEFDPETNLQLLGIGPAFSTRLAKLKTGEIWPATLANAHIDPGMRAVSAGAKPLDYAADLEQTLEGAQGQPVNVTFRDDKTGRTASVSLAAEATGTERPEAKDIEMLGLTAAVQVHAVIPGQPAQVAGVRAGDLIARIDDIPWPSRAELQQTIHASARRQVQITVLRDGREEVGPFSITPNRSGLIGIQLDAQSTRFSGTQTAAPRALRDLHLPPGSRITSVAGTPVDNLAGVQRLLQQAVAQHPRPASVSLGFELALAGAPTTSAPLPIDDAIASQIAQAGWNLPVFDLNVVHGDEQLLVFDPLLERVSSPNPLAATAMGMKKTWQFVLQTYITLARIGQRGVPVSQLQGVVGIATIGTRTTHDSGWPYLLFFLGLISVNLVVINFLPIPVVDGGHMVFLLIEKLRGSPVPVKIQAAATYVGLFLILGVFLMTLYFDIARWF